MCVAKSEREVSGWRVIQREVNGLRIFCSAQRGRDRREWTGESEQQGRNALRILQ